MTFYRDKRPFIITSGLRFSIEPERITSDDVGMRLLLDKESVFHPSVSMRFLKAKKLLTLIKIRWCRWGTCKGAPKRVRVSRVSTITRRSVTPA